MDEKYSVWFVPGEDSDISRILNEVVSDLANRFNAPLFVPHITLQPDVDQPKDQVLKGVQEICKVTKPFVVKLGMMDYTDGLFQTLVSRVEINPELIHINKMIRNTFNRHEDPLYTPHISLLYKKGLENAIKKELILEYENILKNLNFPVRDIHIYTSVPQIEKWEFVGKINFAPI